MIFGDMPTAATGRTRFALVVAQMGTPLALQRTARNGANAARYNYALGYPHTVATRKSRRVCNHERR